MPKIKRADGKVLNISRNKPNIGPKKMPKYLPNIRRTAARKSGRKV